MQEAYYTLTHYQDVIPAQFFLQRMLDGMQLANALTIDTEKAHVIDNILLDWLGYVSYMSAKAAIQFPPRSGGCIKCKGDLRISKLYSKRGGGGGRGRGRCQGSGVRGGCHS